MNGEAVISELCTASGTENEVEGANVVSTQRNDFMFYESFKDSIDLVRKLYSDEEAEIFCMEIITYGVTGEHYSPMRPELEAVMLSIAPLIEKSREHKEETEAWLKKEMYKKDKSRSNSK